MQKPGSSRVRDPIGDSLERERNRAVEPCGKEIIQFPNVDTCGRAKPVEPGIKELGRCTAKDASGERSVTLSLPSTSWQSDMMCEIIGGSSVVQTVSTRTFSKSLGRHLRRRNCSLAVFQTRSCTALVSNSRDTKIADKLQMSPVIQRIAKGMRDGRRQALNFLFRSRIPVQ